MPPKKKAAASDEVSLTLAHPLRAVYARTVPGLDDADYAVGDSVSVRRDTAKSLINAGYASGIEPEKPGQVAAALGDSK